MNFTSSTYDQTSSILLSGRLSVVSVLRAWVAKTTNAKHVSLPDCVGRT